MAWNTLDDLTAGDVVTETHMDEIRGNIEYLLNPNSDSILRNNSGDYSTTSSSFVDIDSSNLTITLTTHGGPVLVLFEGILQTSADHLAFDLTVDGTREGASFSHGLALTTTGNGNYIGPVGFTHIVTGLAAGSHTFKPQWRRVSGTAGNAMRSSSSETPVRFWVIEI